MSSEPAVVPLRDLKQNPSAVVARAEAGEFIDITVRGRPAATIGPHRPRHRGATRAQLEAFYDAMNSDADVEHDRAYAAELRQLRGWDDDESRAGVTALLLDTNIVIERPPIPQQYDELLATSLTYAELEYGISAAVASHRPDAHEVVRRRRRVLTQARESFGEGVPFDDAAASAYRDITGYVIATLPAALRRRAVTSGGVSPRRSSFDLQIAAIALANDLPLATANASDFAAVAKLITVVAL